MKRAWYILCFVVVGYFGVRWVCVVTQILFYPEVRREMWDAHWIVWAYFIVLIGASIPLAIVAVKKTRANVRLSMEVEMRKLVLDEIERCRREGNVAEEENLWRKLEG